MELASRLESLFHTPLLGVQLAGACTAPLLKHGASALEQCRKNTPGYELEQTALDIVISSRIVSNLVTHTKYYYNSSLTHCVYYGVTTVPSCRKAHLHGEIVAVGVLELLTHDLQFEIRDRIARFNRSIGLPVTLAEIGLAEQDLSAVAKKAAEGEGWTNTPYPITKETFIQSMLDADAAGLELLAAASSHVS